MDCYGVPRWRFSGRFGEPTIVLKGQDSVKHQLIFMVVCIDEVRTIE